MRISCFSVDVSVQNDYPLLEKNKKTILRLKCGNKWSIWNPVVINADPFLFVHNDRLYLFYEELTFRNPNGVIRMTSTKNLKHWTKPITVTHDPNVHFSFPYVFEENGIVYMLPECGCTHTVSLYKADNNNLSSFSKYATLVKRTEEWDNVMYDYNDSCFIKRDGIYYLFTTVVRPPEVNELQLRVSTSITGPYEEHPYSPLVIDNIHGRCAGSLLEKDGHLYRFAQDCVGSYGKNVHLLEIDELTSSTFKEHFVTSNILPTEQNFYRYGGHQVNFVKFHGKIIVATDARRWNQFIIPRVFKKIRRLLHISRY